MTLSSIFPHVTIEIRGDPKSPTELGPEGEKQEADPDNQTCELEGSTVSRTDGKDFDSLSETTVCGEDSEASSCENSKSDGKPDRHSGFKGDSETCVDSCQDTETNRDTACSEHADSGKDSSSRDSTDSRRDTNTDTGIKEGYILWR